MSTEARRAAKVEKKLKVLLGGYQARAATMAKQIQELVEQMDTAHVESVTFDALRTHEEAAIPKRIQVLEWF